MDKLGDFIIETGGEFADKRFKTFDIKDDNMDDIERSLFSFYPNLKLAKEMQKLMQKVFCKRIEKNV